MKIIQRCSVCGTVCESYHEWDNLAEFYAADMMDEPEFEHDKNNRDCGGRLTYEEHIEGTPIENA